MMRDLATSIGPEKSCGNRRTELWPRVRMGARQVPRDRGYHLEWRAGAPHVVDRVRPDGPEAYRLNGGRCFLVRKSD